MGGACSCDPKTRQIDSYMHNEGNIDSLTIKLLLLGPGSTGKSTLFKSLQIIHSTPITDAEKVTLKGLIRHHMIAGIHTLMEESNKLYEKDPIRYKDCMLSLDNYENKNELEEAFNMIHHYLQESALTVDASNFMPENLEQLGMAVKLFWNLNCIKQTFANHGNNFAFSDNLEYFFNHLDEIMNEEYVPSDQDCLRNRTKTTGMNKYEYSDGDDRATSSKFVIIDVGGQRAERRKWVAYFDNVQGLLFVASLIDYNKVLYEDSSTNGMVETVNLFSTITSYDAFQSCEIILILNKDDLFQKKLRMTPDNGLVECFSPEAGWPHWTEAAAAGDDMEDATNDATIDNSEYWNTSHEAEYITATLDENVSDVEREAAFGILYDKVINFMLDLFFKRNGTKMQKLYSHVTTATETNLVEAVMSDVQNMLIRKNLSQAGLIYTNHDNELTGNDNIEDKNRENAKKGGRNSQLVRIPSDHGVGPLQQQQNAPPAGVNIADSTTVTP